MTRARIFSQLAGNATIGGGSSANITLASLSPFLTTANVIELTSLYFSNARVYANLQLASLNDLYDVITTNKANGQALVWNGNVWAPGNVTSGVASTDNVPEGTTNLYFTNARARTAFTAGDPTITVDWNTGTIRANVSAIANAASTTDVVTEGYVNKYFTNARVFANLQLASINDLFDVNLGPLANNDVLLYNSDTGKWINGGAIGSSSFFAEYANEANVVLSIANFTTDNLVEGANNKYLTAITLANLLANVSIDKLLDVNTQSNLSVNTALVWDGSQWKPKEISLAQGGVSVAALFANTSGVANVAFVANFANTSGSANVAKVANFANTAGTANVALTANIANTVLTLSNFTTSNLNEGANLYFTNARATIAITPKLTTANVVELGNLYYTDQRVIAAVSSLLSTANVTESSSNLYFTGQRVLDTLANSGVNLRDLNIGGNITVTGNVATLNVGNIQTTSRTITLASAATNKTQAEGSGIYINGANAKITYGEIGDTIGVNKNLTVYGNVLPALSGVFNIGSPTKKFLSIYLGTQTIYLGNVTMSESPTGGLAVTTPTGDPTDGSFANLTAVQSITIDRVYGNVFPLTEFNSYIGGNVAQFLSNTTSNLYIGIRKDADWNKFAGIKIAEKRGPDGNVQSDIVIYNDKENTNNSTARVSILGDGNVEIDANFAIRGNLDVRNNITANGSILFTSGDYIQSGNAIPLTINGTRGINLLSSNVLAWQVKENSYDLVANIVGQANVITKGTATATKFYGNVLANTIITNGISSNTAVLGNISVGTASFDNVVAKTATFDSVVIHTNLKVYGSVETYSSNNMSVSDNMIYLNNGSDTSNPDIGFAFNYNDGSYHHGGFFRDHADGFFKVFDNYSPEPDANIFIDTSHSSFRLANLRATNFVGNVTGYLTGQVSSLGNHNTSDLAEGTNQYFTNTRVHQIIDPLLVTGYIAETTNQYFTNTRVSQVVTPLLTTANVVELNNLYYTNARVYSNVEQMSVNVFSDVDISGIAVNNALVWNGTKFIPGSVTANLVQFAYVANVANTVLTLNNFTTANLAEGINLYFTNARALIGVASGTVQGNITATGTISANAIVANSIITGSGAGGSITGLDLLNATNIFTSNITANVWNNLYSANVIESPTNLFFTNARAISGITPALTTSNVVEFVNLYYTNARVYANVELMSINVFADVDITGIQNSGILQWNGSKFIAGTVSAASTSNTALFAYLANFANTAGVANVSNFANVAGSANVASLATVANTVLTLSNFTTANLVEGTNLYFTNARAAIGLTGQNVTLNDLFVSGNLTVQGDTTTLNVSSLAIEDINVTIAKNASTSAQADGAGLTISGADATLLYKVVGDKFEVNKNFTVNGAITANTWNGLYTSNVIENTNQYFTNTRVLQAVTPLLTTANIVELTNLYYTNARVYSNVELMSINVFADVDVTGILGGGYLEWNASLGKFVPGNLAGKLTTANVNELTNLYFTNARAVAAIQNADAVFGNIRTTGLLTVSSATGAESVTGIEFTNNPVGGVGDTAKLQYYGAGSGDDTIFEISVANNPGDSINFKTAGGGVGINRDRPTADFDVNGNVLIERTLTVQGVLNTSTGQFNTLVSNSLVVNGSTIISADGALANISVYKITANIWNNLYTSNVIETTNLYFTNARVMANVELMSINVFADVDITNVANTNVLQWNGTKFVAAPVTSSLANFANTAGSANTVVSLDNHTTTDLKEGSNLYFTYSRAVSAVTPLLTTANVIETTTQLYYTNARVYSNVEQMSINVFADVDITGITNQGILQWNGTKFVSGSITQSQSSNISLFAYVANVANTVLTLSNFTTTDLVEGSNLYFTNSRVLVGVTTGTIQGNISVSDTVFTTGLVANTLNSNSLVIGQGGSITGANLISANYIQAANDVTVGSGSGGSITGANLISTNYLQAVRVSSDRITSNSLVVNNSLTSSVKVTNIASPNATLITTFSTSAYRTAEFVYTVIGKDAHAKYNSGKMLMLHDDANVYFNQYGILLTGDGEELVTFSADINNSNVRLFATVTASDIVCDVRISGTTYTEN